MISPTVVADLGLRTTTPQDAITVLADGTKTNVLRTAEEIVLLCNGNQRSSKVYVMALDGFDFFIGMDLFYQFGYRISGFQNPLLGPSARFEEVLI